MAIPSAFGLRASSFLPGRSVFLEATLDASPFPTDPRSTMNVARFRSMAAAAAALTISAFSGLAHPGHGAQTVVHNHEGGQIVTNLLWVAGIAAVVALATGAFLAKRGFFKRSEKPAPVRIRRD